MDSEHRHELQENDLAEFLANFGQFWNKHGNTILTVALIVAVVFFGKRWYDSSVATAHEAAWSDLANATSPAALQAVADSHSDPSVRSLAYLRAGDLLLKKASQLATPSAEQARLSADPSADPTPQPPADPEDSHDAAQMTPQQALESAAAMYQRVVRDGQLPRVYRFNAQLGLACVAEEQEDWGEAARQYQEIVEQAGEGYGAIASLATTRLAWLDRVKVPVVFAKEPEDLVDEPAPDELSNSIFDNPLDLSDLPAATAPSGSMAPQPGDAAAGGSAADPSTRPSTQE